MRISKAPSFFPLTPTGMPFSKSTVTSVSLSGASFRDFVSWNSGSCGLFHGSSRSAPSWLMCQAFMSRE